MKLVSLKNVDQAETMAAYPVEQYGYGLRLCLDDDQCEALGITKALRAGTVIKLQAQAVVVSSTESLEDDGDDAGPDVSLSIQITDMGVEVGSVMRNAAQMLYGSGGGD